MPAIRVGGRKTTAAQLNSFIGRAAEIAKLRDLLSASRLVTLTGTGGTGKTRLSIQVAYEPSDPADQNVPAVKTGILRGVR